MIGPIVTLTFSSMRMSIGIFDMMVCAVILFGASDATDSGFYARAGVAAGLTILYFFALLQQERLRLHLAGHTDPLDHVYVHLVGGVSLSLEEIAGAHGACRGGVYGTLVNVLSLGLATAMALAAWSSTGLVASSLVALALLFGGSAVFRMFPVSGLDGGRILQFYVDALFDDEDSGSGAIAVYGFIAGLLPILSGVAIGLSSESYAYWGFAMMAAGFLCLALGPRYRRQSRWIGTATSKHLCELSHSTLPAVRTNAPVSELLSIVAIEGSKATVVVQDEVGRPMGIIQLRQLRGATRGRGLAGVDEIMLDIADLPELSGDRTVLEARMFLERTGWQAAVYKAADGRLRVVSLDELLTL